ncbi:MAG: diacylglycerol kinase family protein, partial [Sphingobium sp.]
RERIDTIIVDGGDGTVRDVLSLAPRHFTQGLPRMAVVPSGKTNALAVDLGIARRWTVREVLSSLSRWKAVRRSPLEIRYDGAVEPRLRGFLFGTGAFVRATNLAQSVHRAGAFNGLAVGLSLAGAVGQTLFGGPDNVWRKGDAVTLELPDGRGVEREFYLLLGSTLEKLPLGLKPFGQVRAGLKLLGVDAPPRRMFLSAPALLTGSEREWLSDAGYKRADTDSFRLRIDSGFVLDGETFPGGDLNVTRGAPIDFLVPA